MLQRFQKIITPTAALWYYLFEHASVSILSGDETNRTADFVAQITFPLVVSLWVLADAHRRGKQLCCDYGAFVFFAWPIFVPLYLFQTRGMRALVTLLCFVGICVLAILFGFALDALREFGS